MTAAPLRNARACQSSSSSGKQVSLPLTERVYQNSGNPGVTRLLDQNCHRILDVGCGSGDNAALVKGMLPQCEIFGITRSTSEAELALRNMKECWVYDIEKGIPDEIRNVAFDAIIFSHVLEHLRYPASIVANFSRLLTKGGQVIIAVPNVLYLPMRLQFLRGDFEYQPAGGILDDTHLHFYTYFTADRYLLSESPHLKLKSKLGGGHVPLPLLRNRIIPEPICKAIDVWGERHWPNLFGHQIVIAAERV